MRLLLMIRRIAVASTILALWLASSAVQAQTSSVGQWQNGPLLPIVPIHVHLLPTGKVMIWPGDEGINGDDPRVWDPATNSVTTLAKTGFDIFCTGHNFLPDGRLFVAGGHIQNGVGLADASIYNPFNNSWSRQPRMNAGRWYPSNTMLPNGDVLVVSGSLDVNYGNNTLPQVWQAATGTWRDLTSAQLALPLYPHMFFAPNGKVFLAGNGQPSRYLDTSGTGSWSNVANRIVGDRDYGSAVMYDVGKILYAGGGSDPPTKTAEVIDLNAANPSWRSVPQMAFARRQMNATVLPDGKVLVTGGTSGPGFNDLNGAVFAAELWNPATETWSTMASASVPRIYHSAALLLPDARVLTTGGNSFNQAEIFSPPYLFAGPRPTISSAPSAVARGQTFFVGTPNAADITQVAWVRIGSVTHTVNMSQGFVRSTFTQTTGGLNVAAPSNANVAPPGHYMLFLLKNGVPSVAPIVRLADGASAPAISSLAPSSATAGGAEFTLNVNGTNFVNGSTVRWNGANRPTTFISATQLTATIPATDIATAGTASVTVTAPDGLVSNAIAFTISGADNPAPTLTSISPTSATAGGATFTLTVTGSNFVSSSVVRWNGANRTTTFVSATQMSASIPAADIAAAGTAQVTVFTPTPGGGTSAAQTFTINAPANNPVPTLTSISPTSATAGGATFTLTVTGSNFVSSSVVRWNGANRTTTFVSATQMSASIPAADIAAAGTAQVTVFTPTPGGGTSAAQTFTINAPPAGGADLTQLGTIIARVTAPTGTGSRNREVIRDGDKPPVGNQDSLRQYDTYDGSNTAADDWIGYTYAATQNFGRFVFQEGRHFGDGGWYETLTVQVRQGGVWNAVSGLTITPSYPAVNDNETFETYTLQFNAIQGDGIRIFGNPGGSADFIAVGELEVFAATGP